MSQEGVKAHQSSPEEVARLFAVYRRHVCDAGISGLSIDGEYCLLFDAGIALAKVVVHADGWRVTGSHQSLERLLRLCSSILGREVDSPIAVLEVGRRKRNRAVYDEVGALSRQEVAARRHALTDLETIVHDWLAHQHPDLLPPELPLG